MEPWILVLASWTVYEFYIKQTLGKTKKILTAGTKNQGPVLQTGYLQVQPYWTTMQSGSSFGDTQASSFTIQEAYTPNPADLNRLAWARHQNCRCWNPYMKYFRGRLKSGSKSLCFWLGINVVIVNKIPSSFSFSCSLFCFIASKLQEVALWHVVFFHVWLKANTFHKLGVI